MSADEDLRKAYEAFEIADYAAAADFFGEVFRSPEARRDSGLRRDMAWNLGLTYALRDELDASRGWFRASGYGAEMFARRRLGEFYRQVILAPR